jgi:myo-inositol-1(or 4)-monophosphatase
MLRASNELAAMIDAARRAGTGLMKRFRRRAELVVELKGPADFVSAADRESEETICRLLARRYPRFGFLAEESAPDARDARARAPDVLDARAGARDGRARFIVDPLDGTANFVHGVPHFAVAIALEREGEIVAGVVLDPAKGETFVAERGRGAWLIESRARLQVAPDRDLARALVAVGVPAANKPERHARTLVVLEPLMREAAGVRRFASAALDLAYVAAGRFAVYFELGLGPWDVAAGSLLVREAGGAVSEPDGGADVVSSGDVLATNGRLHAPTLALMTRAARTAASAPTRRRTPRTG